MVLMSYFESCRVLVTPTTYGQNDPRLRTELEAAVGQVIYNRLGSRMTPAELREALPGVDGHIAGLDIIDRSALECADRLKVIARYGVGMDNVNLAVAHELSIVVTIRQKRTPSRDDIALREDVRLNPLAGRSRRAERTLRSAQPERYGSPS
jgi:D-isomer specific 2-hydroxyacid dehydrogenase, catalytic domain